MTMSTAALAVPLGAVAVMELFELTANEAAVEPKVTPVAPVNPLPAMVTDVPATPTDDESVVTDGFG
jgi:hypothetical protein